MKHQKIIQYRFDYHNLVKDNVSCMNLTLTHHFQYEKNLIQLNLKKHESRNDDFMLEKVWFA